MATVLTTFITANDQIASSPFRSSNPERCVLKTIDLSADFAEEYGLEEDGQLKIEFPFGPKDMQFSDNAMQMDQISRPGKQPLLEKRNRTLSKVSFKAVIASTATAEGGKLNHATGTTPVDPALQTIERIAQSGATCKFIYGTVQLGYNVVLTGFNFTVRHRDSEGHPTRVDADLTLTEKPMFVQELTNLPVIPNDPPPIRIPSAAEQRYRKYYHLLTQMEAIMLDDFFTLSRYADEAGIDLTSGGTDFSIFEKVGFDKLFSSAGQATGVMSNIGSYP